MTWQLSVTPTLTGRSMTRTFGALAGPGTVTVSAAEARTTKRRRTVVFMRTLNIPL